VLLRALSNSSGPRSAHPRYSPARLSRGLGQPPWFATLAPERRGGPDATTLAGDSRDPSVERRSDAAARREGGIAARPAEIECPSQICTVAVGRRQGGLTRRGSKPPRLAAPGRR